MSSPVIQEKDVEHLFDSIASSYDNLNRLLSARQDLRWRKALIKKAIQQLPPTSWSMLDVATGTADLAIALAKAAPFDSKIVGVDISANMLALAEKKAAKAKEQSFSKIDFKKMSAEKLDFNSCSFDGVCISFGIRNVIDKQKALQEFYRVLKPKGSLFVLEFFRPPKSLLSFVFQIYFKHILPFIGGLFGHSKAYHYLPASVDRFETIESFLSLVKKEGFAQIKTKSFLFGSCVLVVGTKE